MFPYTLIGGDCGEMILLPPWQKNIQTISLPSSGLTSVIPTLTDFLRSNEEIKSIMRKTENNPEKKKLDNQLDWSAIFPDLFLPWLTSDHDQWERVDWAQTLWWASRPVLKVSGLYLVLTLYAIEAV